MTNSSLVPPPAMCHRCRLLASPDDVHRHVDLASLGAPSLFPVAFDDQGAATTAGSSQEELGEVSGKLGFQPPGPLACATLWERYGWVL
jgi:hypothetical protein